jgi:lysophospholipase L1-like esterase
MSLAERKRNGAFFVAVAALLVAATCSREGRLETARSAKQKSLPDTRVPASAAPTARESPAPVPSTAPAAPDVSAAPVASAAPLASAGPGASAPLSLPRFDQALAALVAKKRSGHVRIVWLGDSHTAADFMTGAVRRRLQERFGVGGPGLVRVGANTYRHEGVKIVREGRFRIEPEPPSRRTSEGDTALGYEGMRAIAGDTHARVELRVDSRAVEGTLHYELLFDLPPGASFKLAVGNARHLVDARLKLGDVPGSPIRRLHLEGSEGDPFEISGVSGSPRFYGVIIEGSEPGVVLDTSGIDGARVATALAWNPDVFAAELRARAPDLVAIAYGTNEAFDNRPAALIGTELATLVERVRRGAPKADCLVLGPPDAAAPDFSSLPHVAEIEDALGRAAARLGCGFFSLRAAMGGDGSFTRWLKETPPLARGDRVHFTPAGYEELGKDVADALVAGYERRKP